MPHESNIYKVDTFRLKKKLYNLGFEDGFKGLPLDNQDSNYVKGYNKGQQKSEQKFANKGRRNNIDDYFE